MNRKKYKLIKQATGFTDSVLNLVPMAANGAVSSVAPGLGTAISVGTIASGLYGITNEKKPTLDEINYLNAHKFRTLLPSVHAYRAARRGAFLESKYNQEPGYELTTSETLGPYTSSILPIIGGSAIGSTIGHSFGKMGLGSALGAAAGYVVPNLIGGLIGSQRTRSDSGNRRYYGNTNNTLANFFIPGVAAKNKQTTLNTVDEYVKQLNKEKYIKQFIN